MEPDVGQLYSSSPPPLEDGGDEEDEDDFGEFGGYCCSASSSFSFAEFDTPSTFGQMSPPDLNVQNQSGKGAEEVENLQRASKSEPLVNQADPVLNCLEKLKACEGSSSPSEPKQELLEVSNMERHRLPSTIEQRDLESSSTSQEGHCFIDEQRKLNTRTEQEAPVLTSTDNVVGLRTDLGAGSSMETDQASVFLDALLLANASQREKSESKYTGAEKLTESKDVPQNTAGDEQGNNEGLEKGGKKEVSGLGQDEFENIESPESDGTVDGLDFVNVTMSSFKKMLMEEGIVNMDEVTMAGPGTEAKAIVDPTVDLIHDAESEKFPSKVQINFIGSVTDEDEDFGDFSDAPQDFVDITDSSQKPSPDLVTAQSGCSTDDDFEAVDTLRDFKQEEVLGKEQQDGYNCQGFQRSELAPSDSFADFSSAPFGGLADTDGDGWAAFATQQEHEVQQESWATFDEQSSPATVPSTDGLETDIMVDGPSRKLQHLFESTFSSPIRSEDSEVPSLHTLLQPEYNRESSSSSGSREDVALWRHLLDIHSACGLKVQWVGSRSNRILLDCLGIRNILFIGQNKQPVVVPMFAAGLGMLEPSKDPAKPSSTFSAPSPSQTRSTLCAQAVSSLSLGDDDFMWCSGRTLSHLGLRPERNACAKDANNSGSDKFSYSFSMSMKSTLQSEAPWDATTHINLDFFGPVEDCSSDSETETPMPGLDPDLYELTTAKQESSDAGSNIADTFNKLMESIEKNSTVKRKPERNDDMSKEAAQALSLLPDLSYMYSSVLMFPSTLTP